MRSNPIFRNLDIASYADDKNPHSTNKNLNHVLQDLEKGK